MKLFIISDIHGSLSAFHKALHQFDNEKADFMIICGDYLNHGPRNNIPEGYDTKNSFSTNIKYSFAKWYTSFCASWPFVLRRRL